jgi:hypothetical protein
VQRDVKVRKVELGSGGFVSYEHDQLLESTTGLDHLNVVVCIYQHDGLIERIRSTQDRSGDMCARREKSVVEW